MATTKNPYRVTTETRGGRTVYTLHDDTTGASASVLPAYGFNLFDLRLPVAGEVRPVVAVAFPDFADDPRKPGRNGIPVLFPFPNRINHGTFEFRGRRYNLPINSAPHAIHGFAISAPWDVESQQTDAGEAAITGRFQITKNAPEMADHWPTDAVLRLRYGLSGRRLTLTVTVTNPTSEELPYGFGIHPYFHLPLAPGGDPEKTRVVIPASERWVLDGYIPTGERRPVDDRLDFRQGKPIAGLKLDDVLTGLSYDNGGRASCRLRDLALNAELRLGFDRHIRDVVAFTPPTASDVIAVEPYTQTTDALNLAARGVDAGLRVLGHGESDSFAIVIETVG